MEDFQLLDNYYTGFPGIFNIYINKDKTIIYKKNKMNRNGKILINSLKKKEEIDKYKNILLNIKDNQYINKHVIKCFDVENDGSYKCEYIDGYRLDKINNEIINDKTVIDKIIIQIEKLKELLNKNHKFIGGDWALHNLIYRVSDDNIYNIDIEGFYTNLKLPGWGNINKINEFLESVLIKIKY